MSFSIIFYLAFYLLDTANIIHLMNEREIMKKKNRNSLQHEHELRKRESNECDMKFAAGGYRCECVDKQILLKQNNWE